MRHFMRKAPAVIKVVGNALLVAVIVLAMATLLGGEQRDLAVRVDHNAAVAVQEAKETRFLICAILANASTPEIVKAVHTYCEPELLP